MIGECLNCGAKLTYDPIKGKLSCGFCGSTFDAEEDIISEESRRLLEKKKVVKVEDTVDMNVYSCSNCGADIVITDTEASTQCIYCGSPNVVFSRISTAQKPVGIVPFKINKEQAIDIIRKKIGKGFFVPSKIKNFNVECVRGIYIPYWLLDVDISDKMVLKGTVKSGKHSHTYHYLRDCSAMFKDITLDASNKLSDESSIRLEPYDLRELKEFDVNYLAGFYSDVGDTKLQDIRKIAAYRAKEYLHDEVKKSVKARSVEVIKSQSNIDVHDDARYVMLPAWFLTFFYKDESHTILVNGQTGKVVGAVPWDKPKVTSAIIGFGALFSTLASLFYGLILSTPDDDGDGGKLILYGIVFAIMGFVYGFSRFKKIKKNTELTQSNVTYSYVKKRQG